MHTLGKTALRPPVSCVMKHQACLLSLLFFLAALPAFSFEEEAPLPARPLDSLAKSLLVPGWGQLSENRLVEGLFFLTAEAVCVYQFLHWNRKGNAAYESYKLAAAVEDAVRFRRRTETFDARRNRFLLAGALVWAANLVDMSIIIRNKKSGEEKLSIHVGPALSKTPALAVSVHF